MDKLLTACEVAELLGTTEANVRAMRSRGQLPPAIKLSTRRIRWRESDLMAWIDARPQSEG